MCAAGSGARRCNKPEIYKTSCGRVIVEDELLNFLAVKLHTLTQDEIIMLATNNFSSEWIEESKRILFEVCPETTLRNIAHKGLQKDTNNIKACLKVLNECGGNVPRFVSHYLDDLPVVGFGSMDASALLGRVETLSREVIAMRKALEQQTNVCENLRTSTEIIDRRVAEIEQSRSAPGVDMRECASGERAVGAPSSAVLEETLDQTDDNEPADYHASAREWTTVVKEGRRVKHMPQPAVEKKPSAFRAPARRERKKTGVTGTSTASSIQAVTTKLVSLFATRFNPALEAETLCDYLTGKLNNKSVTCRKIASTQSRYSSFHVVAECNDVAALYDPELWPAGAYIRRYYEARRPGGAYGAGQRDVRDSAVSALGKPPVTQGIAPGECCPADED